MPHIHAQIDLVVSAFIVRHRRVLLVDHRKLGGWFPVGGHVELDQDTDQAMDAEIAEEAGLTVEFIHPPSNLGLSYPPHIDLTRSHNTRRLRPPWAVEIHDFPPLSGHRHLCLIYLARGLSDHFSLAAAEHKDIGWFDYAALDRLAGQGRSTETVLWWCRFALAMA